MHYSVVRLGGEASVNRVLASLAHYGRMTANSAQADVICACLVAANTLVDVIRAYLAAGRR
jgi:hypothetical protein